MENEFLPLLTSLIYGLSAILCAGLLAYALTPPVRVLAFIIGAIDIPLDARRMHTKPTPRIGGLAIFASFAVTTFIFCTQSKDLYTIWLGGLVLVILGILDDRFRLPAWSKLLVQIGAAGIAVLFDVRITHITLYGKLIEFGDWSIPLTILWIVGLTNAINLIDGLDGLACGVSAITSLSILGVVLLMGEYDAALITAVLAGACLGFLPFNSNPARIFMGDTGALFLGYTLAVVSVTGVFKLHTVLSFAVPLSIFALPLLDTLFAILRRVKSGQSPFAADRSHLHHKLVDMGFSQKESVRILYAICGMLGLVAITFTDTMFNEARLQKSLIVAIVAIIVFLLNFLIMQKTSTRVLSGLAEHGYEAVNKEDEKNIEKMHVEHNPEGEIVIAEGSAEADASNDIKPGNEQPSAAKAEKPANKSTGKNKKKQDTP